MLFMLVMDVLG
jgi:hypothetical protein